MSWPRWAYGRRDGKDGGRKDGSTKTEAIKTETELTGLQLRAVAVSVFFASVCSASVCSASVFFAPHLAEFVDHAYLSQQLHESHERQSHHGEEVAFDSVD